MMDYSSVTETPGNRITREAASMLCTRYAHAARYCHAKDVLEVGCGAGLGLGYLARRARRIVGGDYTESLLRKASEHYRGRISLVRLDAQTLPFPAAFFDTVIFYEALYYLARPQAFFDECRRILRPEGTLLLCVANKDWTGFNPSPLSCRYYSARELHGLLAANSFRAEVFGAFPAALRTASSAAITFVRKLAVGLNLIPKTMKQKEFLKRAFYGRLVQLGEEVDEAMAKCEPLVPLPADVLAPQYKVLYAFGHCDGSKTGTA